MKGSLENLLLQLDGIFKWRIFMPTKPKPKSAEEEKKKQAYYSKTEKKAKAVKK